MITDHLNTLRSRQRFEASAPLDQHPNTTVRAFLVRRIPTAKPTMLATVNDSQSGRGFCSLAPDNTPADMASHRILSRVSLRNSDGLPAENVSIDHVPTALQVAAHKSDLLSRRPTSLPNGPIPNLQTDQPLDPLHTLSDRSRYDILRLPQQIGRSAQLPKLLTTFA